MKIFFPFTLLCFSLNLLAQAPVNLTDLNPGGDGLSRFNSFFLVNSGSAFFLGDNGQTGQELYKITGSTVSLVNDLNPGKPPSSPTDIKVYQGKILFNAYQPTLGYRAYTTDGTTAGTQSLISLLTGFNGDALKGLAPVADGRIFFTSKAKLQVFLPGTNTVVELPCTVDDVQTYSNVEFGPRLVPYKDGIVAVVKNAAKNQAQIWYSDGTVNGTKMIASYAQGQFGKIYGCFVLNNKVIFLLREDGNATNGYYSWSGNANEAPVRIFNTTADPKNDVLGVSRLNDANILFITAGNGLFVSNGEPGMGTINVASPTVNKFGVKTGNLPVLLNGKLYLTNEGSTGVEIWESNGTAAGTKIVQTLNTENTVQSLVAYGNQLVLLTNASANVKPAIHQIDPVTKNATLLYRHPSNFNTTLNMSLMGAYQDELYLQTNYQSIGQEIYKLALKPVSSTVLPWTDSYTLHRTGASQWVVSHQEEHMIQLELYTLDGKLLLFRKQATSTPIELPLNAGIHFLRVQGKAGLQVFKLGQF